MQFRLTIKSQYYLSFFNFSWFFIKKLFILYHFPASDIFYYSGFYLSFISIYLDIFLPVSHIGVTMLLPVSPSAYPIFFMLIQWLNKIISFGSMCGSLVIPLPLISIYAGKSPWGGILINTPSIFFLSTISFRSLKQVFLIFLQTVLSSYQRSFQTHFYILIWICLLNIKQLFSITVRMLTNSSSNFQSIFVPYYFLLDFILLLKIYLQILHLYYRNHFHFLSHLFTHQLIYTHIWISRQFIKRIKIQMTSEEKKEIVQYCKQINQKCQFDYKNFSFDDLRSRNWYLSILEILFPHLEQKNHQIKKMTGQAKAIARIIQQINDLDQFQKLHIDAEKVADGDVNQISNMVQIIFALLQIVTNQYEEGQIQSHQEVQNYKSNNKIMFQQGLSKQKKSMSDSQKPKSVQAIVNQFEKSEQQEDYTPFNDHIQNKFSSEKVENQEYEAKKMFDEPYKKEKKGGNENERYKKMTEQDTLAKKLAQKKTKLMNLQKQHGLFGSKTKKKLVVFPKSPQTLKKAKSNEQLLLTRKIEQNMKTNKKSKKGNKGIIKSPMEVEAKRKKKELQYKERMYGKQVKQNENKKSRQRDFGEKNEKNLEKILNFKEGQLRKQRQQYEQSIKMRVLDQRELYIKKINNLMIELERQKQIQEKKDFKQSLIKENQEAVKKLKSLQEWYRNKVNILKQRRGSKNKERMLVRSGHKQIIGKIEKELKKENEQRLVMLTNKFREEQYNIETDFEQLKTKIIKAYHKY